MISTIVYFEICRRFVLQDSSGIEDILNIATIYKRSVTIPKTILLTKVTET